MVESIFQQVFGNFYLLEFIFYNKKIKIKFYYLMNFYNMDKF